MIRFLDGSLLHLGAMSALPTGTVTFLFADVEGSTRLARELGEGWQAVLADLRRLLREAVAGADGHEVDSRGDELFAVFTEAETAAQAAIEAQRRIAGHTWPAPVRARIGLHTGAAALGEDGYVGVDVHRAFRIANAGHGGQIVSSEATALVLAPGHELRDLGLWALQELPDPERIFQLDEPGLGGDFPALRARPGATPVRVVLADDSSCSGKGWHGSSTTPASTSWRSPATPTTSYAMWRCTSRMWRWSTSGCRRRRRTRGCAPPRRSASGIRKRACSCSPSTSSRATRWISSQTAPRASATCLKDRVADIDEFAAAVRRVSEGGSALDPAVVSQLVGRHRRDDPLASSRPESARCWS